MLGLPTIEVLGLMLPLAFYIGLLLTPAAGIATTR